jgi:hypothetical protein
MLEHVFRSRENLNIPSRETYHILVHSLFIQNHSISVFLFTPASSYCLL